MFKFIFSFYDIIIYFIVYNFTTIYKIQTPEENIDKRVDETNREIELNLRKS